MDEAIPTTVDNPNHRSQYSIPLLPFQQKHFCFDAIIESSLPSEMLMDEGILMGCNSSTFIHTDERLSNLMDVVIPEVTPRKEMLEKFESTEEEQHPTREHQMFDEMPIHKEVEKKYVDESSTPLIDEKPEEFAAVVNNNDSSHIIQVHIAATVASAEKNHYAMKDSVTNSKKYMSENNLTSEVDLKGIDKKIDKLV